MNWGERYRSGNTPWDLGRAHPELERRLASGWGSDLPFRRVIVPGCGNGHDALAFAEAGWTVTAVDLVDATGGRLGAELRKREGKFIRTDVLGLDPPERFDLLWDHTFFCAIEPKLRSSWGAMVDRVISPEGCLAGISFPEDRDPGIEGPPWRMSVDDVERHLRGFSRLDVSTPVETVGRRIGREHWYTLVRI